MRRGNIDISCPINILANKWTKKPQFALWA